ncbi:thiamin-monophosphate kinase [Georgfuchsia toluolica]|uniref:Thiamine-monophosphate kinase n=1 Tax=Georgfuchsia toluolica TaxID=424218 RepID=A0A916N0Y2_9PROT|nr:thiamine-phosphate kinase [Georgfuchsia toluolica]CAG4884378.1 thiamin-monophosphate kinase [Georgfuchsia toluolica]
MPAETPSEFDLIERYFKRTAPSALLGVGDDAAIIEPATGMQLLMSTDMLVAGTHFLPDAEPEALGWKTLAVNVSDLAAMGATPRWTLLALALPKVANEADEAWIAAFARGFFACADAFGIELIGGDTTRGPLNFCVTILGEAPAGQALLRSGARVGDDVWVSGQPGRAALGLAHLQGRCVLDDAARNECLAALHRPQPRIALGLALRNVASAAIDVSDGLLADLGHILDASHVSAEIQLDRLPTLLADGRVPEDLVRDCILAGGDDYELAFTAAAGFRPRIESLASSLQLALTRIGSIAQKGTDKLRLIDSHGQKVAVGRLGYDHFLGHK